MRPRRRQLHTIIVAASALLVVDLFLDWHRTTVDVGGAFAVRASSSGWAGWGLAAGAFAIALVGVLAAARAGYGEQPLAALLLGGGMLAATLLAAFTGRADVELPAVGVHIDSTGWPARAGVILAGIAAGACLVHYLHERPRVAAAPPRGASRA